MLGVAVLDFGFTISGVAIQNLKSKIQNGLGHALTRFDTTAPTPQKRKRPPLTVERLPFVVSLAFEKKRDSVIIKTASPCSVR